MLLPACSPASLVHTPNFTPRSYSPLQYNTCIGYTLDYRQCSPKRQLPSVCRSANCEPLTVLPNGLEVCYASKYDVDFLYREIFQEQVYMQHGIQLNEGDIVIDVGGNIGFFALFAAEHVGSHGTVITAEPIPALHTKLQYNVQSHSKSCSSQGKHFLVAWATTWHCLHGLHVLTSTCAW